MVVPKLLIPDGDRRVSDNRMRPWGSSGEPFRWPTVGIRADMHVLDAVDVDGPAQLPRLGIDVRCETHPAHALPLVDDGHTKPLGV